MTQEEKELLIKDLCARLPYGVKIRVEYPFLEEKDWCPENLYGLDLRRQLIAGTSIRIEEVKPYLRPMSSMTEEQNKEWLYTLSSDYHITCDTVDWCNKNHFDYRCLIEKGLAIDATGLNIY